MSKLFTPAENVGIGVDRANGDAEKPVFSRADVPLATENGNDFRFGAAWSDTPYIKDQQEKYPASVKFDRNETVIYDLSVPEQLAAMNTIQTLATNTDGNIMVAGRESHWCESTGNWKVMLVLQYLKFRELVRIKK